MKGITSGNLWFRLLYFILKLKILLSQFIWMTLYITTITGHHNIYLNKIQRLAPFYSDTSVSDCIYLTIYLNFPYHCLSVPCNAEEVSIKQNDVIVSFPSLQTQLSELSSVLVAELSLTEVPQAQELKTLLRSLRSDDKDLNDSIAAMKER